LVVIRDQDHDFFQKILDDFYWPQKSKINVCFGGETRTESVLNATKFARQSLKEFGYIMTHDSARPFASLSLFEGLIKKIVNSNNSASKSANEARKLALSDEMNPISILEKMDSAFKFSYASFSARPDKNTTKIKQKISFEDYKCEDLKTAVCLLAEIILFSRLKFVVEDCKLEERIAHVNQLIVKEPKIIPK
jgi:hypothetical protein